MGIEVKYDGNVIANISVGKTVELKCIDKKMLSDIVISYKTNDVEEETPSDVPTDLSNYIVYVPSGWSATSGYGLYNIEYNSSTNGFGADYLGIGYKVNALYDDSPTALNNSIVQYDVFEGVIAAFENYTNNQSFSIYITGGTDVTKPELIQWFVDNGATFTYNHSGGA